MNPNRTSPLEAVMVDLKPAWTEIRQMKVPVRFGADDGGIAQKLGLSDLSFLPRCGLKGPGAERWLETQGIAVPAINRWDEIADGGIVARLGGSEFFIEDGLKGNTVARLTAALATRHPDVAPVFRQDAALAIAGREVSSLLVQTCNVNFGAFPMHERHIVMTSMTGVSVLVARTSANAGALYRVWCDGTFGPYLWNTLLEIARELGGGAIGVGTLFPEARL